MKIAILSAAMISLLLGACANFVGVGDDDVSLDFSSWLASPGQGPLPEFVVRGAEGRIEVQGAIGTPVPCYDVRSEATRTGRNVVLEVSAAAQQVMCVQVVAAFGYEAMLGRLDPGTYRLRVVHTHHNGGSTRTETITEQDVRVR